MTKNIRSNSLLIILVTFLLSSCSNEKNREIFEDFEGEEGVYMIKLPPALFLGILDSEAEIDGTEIGNIDFIKLLVFDESKVIDKKSRDISGEIKKKFDKYGYELAIQFTNDGSDIAAYILENEEHVSDLMILVDNDETFIGLGLSGELNGSGIMNLASEIDFDDLNSFIDIDGFGF